MMPNATRRFILVALLCAGLGGRTTATGAAPATPGDSLSLAALVRLTEQELAALYDAHDCRVEGLQQRLKLLDDQLVQTTARSYRLQHLGALEEKIRLQSELLGAEEDFQMQLLRARYAKGVDLIKVIYEKLLSLDHHFTSIQTFQQINAMSNPNSYQAFQQNRALLEERMKKKGAVSMPAIFQSNPYLSATYSLVSTLFSDGDSRQKEKDLEQIACILDFTVRMNNDLNTIYYETEYLKQHTISLQADCIALFGDYTRPIGYLVPLDRCRKEDDWEAVSDALEKVVTEIKTMSADPTKSKLVLKHQINLEFAIDRLLDFINRYTTFISLGEKYYQKFLVIASNYQNESKCAGELPKTFTDLRRDIEVSIEKFGTSYKLTELKGSKMKDLLYGIPEN